MRSIKETSARAAGIRQRARSLMLYSLFTAISAGMTANAHAQTFSEWFFQKKTQKKYLLQQIAALQVYSGYVKKGYGIARNGLGSISGYLSSEHILHNAYYARLNTVDPSVSNAPMVREIMEWQQDILKRTKEIAGIRGMATSERRYLNKVSEAVLHDCDQQLAMLEKAIHDHELEMSDEERISLITKIHAAMQANYQFASGFAAQVKVLFLTREREEDQARASKQIFGIN